MAFFMISLIECVKLFYCIFVAILLSQNFVLSQKKRNFVSEMLFTSVRAKKYTK